MLAAKYFSWVIDDKIGGMPRPDVFGTLSENLDKLKKIHKIGIVINLTERPLDAYELKKREMKYYHIPIEDFTAPKIEQFLSFKKIYENSNVPIAIHCYAGKGRTGTILAAALIIEGYTPEEAIKLVKSKRPGSIENDLQKESIFEFFNHLKHKI